MQDFRNLEVWRKAQELTLKVYLLTKSFPADERLGLTAQLRRCCASIPANLAEGCGRATDSDFARFVQIALGSALDTDYHFLLAQDLAYLDKAAYESLQKERQPIKRMLNALYQRLTKKRKPPE